MIAVDADLRRGRIATHNRGVKNLLPVAALAALVSAPAASAQISLRPADVIVPVVGSTAGQANAQFRTGLQLANPTGSSIGGWLVLRPHGLYVRYEIAARGTLSFADVVAEMGGSGLGSLDLLADGAVLPTIVARAYDDQPDGTTGVGVPAVPAAAAMGREERGLLITPRDLTRYRFNVGVRALTDGATLHVIVRSPEGMQRNARVLTLADDEFVQQPASDFAGIVVSANETIEVSVAAGSAIVYATTVDNQTNDGTLQLLHR